jgi:phenylacetate-CoA ligase
MTGPFQSDRRTLELNQLTQLRSLLAELIPGNKFHSRKLEAAWVGFDVASLADFTTRFPFTTKAEIVADQLAHPPYGTNLTYPLNCYSRFHQTSGTSGVPLRWLDTPESWEHMLASWREVFHAAGVTANDRVLFAFSFGPFIGFWLAFESASRLGCLCLPGGGLSSEARVKMIMDNRVTVLCCTPTYALRLGEVAAPAFAAHGCPARQIIVAGEPGGSVPATRQRIAELWPGARVFDHHGMTETGPVTYECPAQPGVLHVIESAFLPEVIEPATGRPAAQGELVLTTLLRTGSPLLRYRTGDLVKRADVPCPCGNAALGLAGGILGRVDDMVIVRGVNVHPTAVEQILRGFRDIGEYRVHVSEHNSLVELRVEIEPVDLCADSGELRAQVQRALENAFNLRIPVERVPPGSLPRFEMKARRWIIEGNPVSVRQKL